MIAWPVDAVGRAVALLLLAMSCVSWALIGWKLFAAWRLRRALAQALPAFWAAADWDTGRAALQGQGGSMLLPLLDAARAPLPAASLSAQLPGDAARMRPLRDALQALLAALRRGQAVLASIGATAPFVGLLGTVWGIYLALLGLGQDGAPGIARIAAPVGEALVMTAAGLLVAIPAVLAYNAINQQLSEAEAVLDGFAHDLLALVQRP